MLGIDAALGTAVQDHPRRRAVSRREEQPADRVGIANVTHRDPVSATPANERLRERRTVDDEGIAERIASAELTDAEVARREEAREVRGALAELPADQRQVIELAYFGGFTHTQIASMLELPVGTVKGRMRLGLTKMRLTLGDPAQVIG